MVLEYDGGFFHGWQSQLNANSVQDAVAGAIAKLDGAPVNITAAGRTDAGVHARGQVANFFTDSRIPADKYAYALNTILPSGVVCLRSYEAPPDFHARFSATSKVYSYLILNRRQPSALYKTRAWHVPLPLDVGAMREAAPLFTGERDFHAFMSSGSPVRSTIRKVTRLEIETYPIEVPFDTPNMIVAGFSHNYRSERSERSERSNRSDRSDTGPAHNPEETGRFVKLIIEANGFLYNMVRIITGTLVYAGQDRLNADDIRRAFASGERGAAGKTAPPQGLCLEYVRYERY